MNLKLKKVKDNTKWLNFTVSNKIEIETSPRILENADGQRKNNLEDSVDLDELDMKKDNLALGNPKKIMGILSKELDSKR